MDIHALLADMKPRVASDLYLKVGLVPNYRVDGTLVDAEKEDPITDADMDAAIALLLNDFQRRRFDERPDIDFGYSLPDGARFRINLFRQQGHIGLVARHVRDEDLSFEGLHLPKVMAEFAEMPRGLVLLTGATGSGKSTTLAAMIQHINRNFRKHVMTIEDPIEFMYVDDKCVINQREVGFDTQNFADALRHVVRQSPDVILIGEMRDNDTMMTAISAAETGHLVLSTLHTSDVSHTLDRIINYFPDHLKSQVRQELALSLQGIICMRLLARLDGRGRVPAFEILRATPSVRKALQEGQIGKLKELMQNGTQFGMCTFNQSLLKLFRTKKISLEDALAASTSPEELKLNTEGMFTGSGTFQTMV